MAVYAIQLLRSVETRRRFGCLRMLFLLLFSFLTFSVMVANPKKTTLHGGQSRSWSAEQGKKIFEKKSGSAPLPRCSFGENKIKITRLIYMSRRYAGRRYADLGPSHVRTRIPSTRRRCPPGAPIPSSNLVPFGSRWHARGREHCGGKPCRATQHAQAYRVITRFGESGEKLDRRRARRVLNPYARELKT